MTNNEIIKEADRILLEVLGPYKIFPKWAAIIRHLDEEFEEFSGIRDDYHEKYKKDLTTEEKVAL